MIGNFLNILVGLWLAYSAIFANPTGAMNNVALAASAIAIIIFAVWARQSDSLSWQSGTNIVLAAMLLVVAVVRWAIGVAPLVCFWIILLVGISVAIVAMWSLLYRAQMTRSAASRKMSFEPVRRLLCSRSGHRGGPRFWRGKAKKLSVLRDRAVAHLRPHLPGRFGADRPSTAISC